MLGADVWKVTFPFDAASSGTMVAQLQKQMEAQPVWLSFNNIGERVAGQMQTKAIAFAGLESILHQYLYLVPVPQSRLWFGSCDCLDPRRVDHVRVYCHQPLVLSSSWFLADRGL